VGNMVDWKRICGKCKRRGLCCCIEPIYITKKEEKKICEKTGVNSFTENRLLKKNEKMCVFLKNKLCTIHDIKPLDCRAYPIVFWSDAGHGRISYFLDLDCPMAMNLSKKDIKEIQSVLELELKDWSKEDLYRYDVCAYWKPEKLKKKSEKKTVYPFGVEL
jgi:Fe-S-cluster containining protein